MSCALVAHIIRNQMGKLKFLIVVWEMCYAFLRGKPKEWGLVLPHAVFALNWSQNQTTKCSPFEIVCGQNPNSVLDLAPIPNPSKVNKRAEEMADYQVHS